MEMKDQRVRGVLEDLAIIVEKTYRLIEEVAADAGFYRKRVADVEIGDEVGWGGHHWCLVTDITFRQATFPNDDYEVCHLTFEVGPSAAFDAEDFLDVRAQPPELDPETGKVVEAF